MELYNLAIIIISTNLVRISEILTTPATGIVTEEFLEHQQEYVMESGDRLVVEESEFEEHQLTENIFAEMMNGNGVTPENQTPAPNVHSLFRRAITDNYVNAYEVPSDEICVGGFIYLSKGLAGENSFYVYRQKGVQLHVIAHILAEFPDDKPDPKYVV